MIGIGKGVAVALAVGAIVIAAPAAAVIDDVEVATAPKPTGTIIIYREGSIIGAAIACPIKNKGQEVAELGRGKYVEWVVSPGRYILGNGATSIEVSVDAGETRYVRCKIKQGFFIGKSDLQIVDGEEFDKKKKDLEQKELNPDFRPAATQSQ